jgi:endo-1,4-beta-D-glucanase Y
VKGRFRGCVIIGALLASAAAAGCRRDGANRRSNPDLARAWGAYKQVYLRSDGYVLDRTRNNGEVTSEAQGYALLRAAWMDDAATFDRVFQWTEARLRRPDGLFSWRWTPSNGGRVLDANTASDADQEIAFALIIAAEAFHQPAYRVRARALLPAIRAVETVHLEAGGWFPSAGNWASGERIVNLSYFLPYAYPYFAQLDPGVGWDRAIDTGYDLLDEAQRGDGVRLVPDFAVLDGQGRLTAPPAGSGLRGDFSSDAMRVYWRTAVDCGLHQRLRACADPLRVGYLQRLLARDGSFYTRYALDGVPSERTMSMSFYGAALPYLMLQAPATGSAVRARLSPGVLDAISEDGGRYYDANWIWFGVAAADGLIERRTPAVASVR